MFRLIGIETNFKLSHGNITNNSITVKTRPFQQQQQQQQNSYGNRNFHSKVIAEQTFKIDLDVVLLKVSNIQCTNEGYLDQKHIQNS